MVGVRLFVGNIPYRVSEQGLRDLLSQVGAISGVMMPVDRLTGRPRGFALVDVPSEADAREIIRQFDGYVVDTRPLRVERAVERGERPAYAPAYRARGGLKGRPEPWRRRPERSAGR